MKKSELNHRDRYKMAENIPCEPVTKRHLILAVIFFLFLMIGIPVFMILFNYLFPVA